jgi:hypothetical protein
MGLAEKQPGGSTRVARRIPLAMKRMERIFDSRFGLDEPVARKKSGRCGRAFSLPPKRIEARSKMAAERRPEIAVMRCPPSMHDESGGLGVAGSNPATPTSLSIVRSENIT